jgi:hypothetical protein
MYLQGWWYGRRVEGGLGRRMRWRWRGGCKFVWVLRERMTGLWEGVY